MRNVMALLRKELHVYVLAWDFAMMYALERELLPVYTKSDLGAPADAGDALLVSAATGAGVVAAGAWRLGTAAALEPVRQGYQTNMWGMPTYYLLRSGQLEKHGIKYEEFAVPSGNLTMQQMVARQVDMGTYAGPSFIIGNARGGLVAIAQIEQVGKTVRVMARKPVPRTVRT